MPGRLDQLEWIPCEIGEPPDLVGIVKAMQESDRPILLQRNGEDLGVLLPVALAEDFGIRGPITEADRQAFREAAGSWSGLVDADKLIEEIYEGRRIASRDPVER